MTAPGDRDMRSAPARRHRRRGGGGVHRRGPGRHRRAGPAGRRGLRRMVLPAPRRRPARARPPSRSTSVSSHPHPSRSAPASPRCWPQIAVLLVVALLTFLVTRVDRAGGAAGGRIPAARGPVRAAPPTGVRALADAVDDGLEALVGGPVDDVIVACWVRLEEAAAAGRRRPSTVGDAGRAGGAVSTSFHVPDAAVDAVARPLPHRPVLPAPARRGRPGRRHRRPRRDPSLHRGGGT